MCGLVSCHLQIKYIREGRLIWGRYKDAVNIKGGKKTDLAETQKEVKHEKRSERVRALYH